MSDNILSAEARAALKLPLQAQGLYLVDAGGTRIGSIVTTGRFSTSVEITTFIATLVNTALSELTPAPSPLTALERAVVEAAKTWNRGDTLANYTTLKARIAALLAAEANAAAPG